MAIEAVTYELLKSLNARFDNVIAGDVAILGDCTFYLPGLDRDNRKALAHFAADFRLRSAVTLDLYGDPTIRCDLHEPIGTELRNRFNAVIDAGTMSFCFNVPAMWKNVLDMLTEDGCVFHLSSLTGWFGRAYYSFSPKLFHDFYSGNGFDILYMGIRSHRRESLVARTLDRLMRLKGEDSRGYREIGKDALFLKAASPIGMEFGSAFSGTPQSLPNDATIVCLARRKQKAAFRNIVSKAYEQFAR